MMSIREPAYAKRAFVQRDPIYRRRFYSFLSGMEAARDGVPITSVPSTVPGMSYRIDKADWEDGWRNFKITPVKTG